MSIVTKYGSKPIEVIRRVNNGGATSAYVKIDDLIGWLEFRLEQAGGNRELQNLIAKEIESIKSLAI